MVVACRYWYELTDGFWGQFTLTNLPHLYAKQLLPGTCKHLESMQNFVGMIEYLMTWKWHDTPGIIRASEGFLFQSQALPMRISDGGEILTVGSAYVAGEAVFASDKDAFEYMLSLALRDLQYRGLRDGRTGCFEQKQNANFLLYRRILRCDNDAEYELSLIHI